MASSNWSVSLIIPNYNGRQLLAENLPQVMAAARGAEVIVVDDASTDDSVAWLKQRYPLVRLVSLKQNRRFARACNAGVKAARGEIVVLLNNDVSPQVDFLTPAGCPEPGSPARPRPARTRAGRCRRGRARSAWGASCRRSRVC